MIVCSAGTQDTALSPDCIVIKNVYSSHNVCLHEAVLHRDALIQRSSVLEE